LAFYFHILTTTENLKVAFKQKAESTWTGLGGCPEIIQPFWISWEPVVWSWLLLQPVWGDLTMHPLSHSPVGLVSRQWDAVDWACVLCVRRIHNDRASRSASSWQCACPFYSSRSGFFGKAPHQTLQPKFGSLRLLAFPKAKIAVKGDTFQTALV